MTDIEQLLDTLFTFKRIERPADSMRREMFYEQKGGFLTQKDKTGAFPEYFGVIAGWAPGREGMEIYDYSFSEKVSKEGELIKAPGLPESLSKFKDCEYFYYGLKLNILGYFTGERIGKLALIDSCNDNTPIPYLYRPYLAVDFLRWASDRMPRSQKLEPVEPTFRAKTNLQQTLSL